MIVTIHQPEHLPWLGYFHKMALAEHYVFLDCTQFRHQYFQNRNRILGSGGPVWLTVPVRKLRHRYGMIREQLIDNSIGWQARYLNVIHNHYSRARFYERYQPEIAAIIHRGHDLLVEINYDLIAFFRQELGVHTQLHRASDLGVSGLRSDLIAAICEAMGADVYISGPTGREYLDEPLLKRAGVEVVYHEFQHPVYSQVGPPSFVPRLSALDLLMHHGPRSRNILGLDFLSTGSEVLAVTPKLPAPHATAAA